MKKYVIVIFLSIIIVDGYMIMRILVNKNSVNHTSQITNTNTIPKIPVTPVEFTGAIKEEIKISVAVRQISKLIDSLPINTTAFTMSMDYTNNFIIVTILSPSAKNYPIFQKWIVDNGFDQIPQEKFTIVYQ